MLERKIQQKLVTSERMHTFSVLHSFTQMCRKLKLVPWKHLVHIIKDPRLDSQLAPRHGIE